ncbi:hypothetical protein [Vibrio coralliilyticus]|jgi:hypothetical protein|nr:hypothetical protein [Vibrio coralliilyticus]MCC2525770.1 hypothetical protein [Vibrio coralliilyticus]
MKYEITQRSDKKTYSSNSMLGLWLSFGKEQGFAFASRFCLSMVRK